jgi:hypothetical protein
LLDVDVLVVDDDAGSCLSIVFSNIRLLLPSLLRLDR